MPNEKSRKKEGKHKLLLRDDRLPRHQLLLPLSLSPSPAPVLLMPSLTRLFGQSLLFLKLSKGADGPAVDPAPGESIAKPDREGNQSGLFIFPHGWLMARQLAAHRVTGLATGLRGPTRMVDRFGVK